MTWTAPRLISADFPLGCETASAGFRWFPLVWPDWTFFWEWVRILRTHKKSSRESRPHRAWGSKFWQKWDSRSGGVKNEGSCSTPPERIRFLRKIQPAAPQDAPRRARTRHSPCPARFSVPCLPNLALHRHDFRRHLGQTLLNGAWRNQD